LSANKFPIRFTRDAAVVQTIKGQGQKSTQNRDATAIKRWKNWSVIIYSLTKRSILYCYKMVCHLESTFLRIYRFGFRSPLTLLCSVAKIQQSRLYHVYMVIIWLEPRLQPNIDFTLYGLFW